MTYLVGDIGGTNARFALAEPGRDPGDAVVLRCADHENLAAAVRAGLDRLGARPATAALAIAGPVHADRVAMTNLDWTFSKSALQKELGLKRLAVVNDFEAVAWALPKLGEMELVPLGPPATAESGLARAVLGPGTGLGQSGLIPGPGGWAAIAGEGGHTDFAPQDDRQAAVWRRLKEDFDHVSLECVLSGPGLVNLYRALASLDGMAAALDDPADIGAAGAPPPAGEAVALFSRILGATAGNLALSLGALGGVYIAGGIVPALGDRFDQTGFRRAFEAKGRFQTYLRAVPTFLITAPTPALTGLAHLLDQPHPD
ncbi:MAG: glucokinase [Minwuiales bacterium]|nr:glucokinase [Minwuiales bacterium]